MGNCNCREVDQTNMDDTKLTRSKSLQRRLTEEETPKLTRKSSQVLGLPLNTSAKALNTL